MYGQLFRQADTENVGVVTGEIAVKFFEKTRLDSRVLGEVSLTPKDANRVTTADICSLGTRYGKLQIERTVASSHRPASVSSCGLLGTRKLAGNRHQK